MELDISNQCLNFLKSFLFGFSAFVFFDIFRIVRSFFRCGAVSVFFQDLIYFFFVSVSAVIFLFAVNDAEIRLYILGAILFGWIIGFLSYGKLSSYCVGKCRKKD